MMSDGVITDTGITVELVYKQNSSQIVSRVIVAYFKISAFKDIELV